MEKRIILEIKELIAVIMLTQSRETALRRDLDFVRQNIRIRQDWTGPLKRLEHQIMFLCVDAHSLHEGISKKKSFYSKIIKQYGKQFLKTDKSPTLVVQKTQSSDCSVSS